MEKEAFICMKLKIKTQKVVPKTIIKEKTYTLLDERWIIHESG